MRVSRPGRALPGARETPSESAEVNAESAKAREGQPNDVRSSAGPAEAATRLRGGSEVGGAVDNRERSHLRLLEHRLAVGPGNVVHLGEPAEGWLSPE